MDEGRQGHWVGGMEFGCCTFAIQMESGRFFVAFAILAAFVILAGATLRMHGRRTASDASFVVPVFVTTSFWLVDVLTPVMFMLLFSCGDRKSVV